MQLLVQVESWLGMWSELVVAPLLLECMVMTDLRLRYSTK